MKRPTVVAIFKPPRITSYDLVRQCKHLLYQQGHRKIKIGHFGTLDPFASGLMLMGIYGASRLNNYVHEDLTKTYLAIGKLGVETPTGDLTVPPAQIDDSKYLNSNIAHFDIPFLQEYLQKFVGEYWQSPHAFSASKFQGKALHKWAREGMEIKKAPVRRFIHQLSVVKYNFPYLFIRCQVSSGTYVRTLFSDIARDLGTLGSLVSLVREQIGDISVVDTFRFQQHSPELFFTKGEISVERLLPYGRVKFPMDRAKAFANGLSVLEFQAAILQESHISNNLYWVYDSDEKLLGLAEKREDRFFVKLNFPH